MGGLKPVVGALLLYFTLQEGEVEEGIGKTLPQLASSGAVAVLILKIPSDRARRWVRTQVAVSLVVELELMEKGFNIDVVCSLHVRVAGRRFLKLKVRYIIRIAWIPYCQTSCKSNAHSPRFHDVDCGTPTLTKLLILT